MYRPIRNVGLILAALLASGCAAPLRLTNGTYTAQGAGTLTVTGERMEVRLPKLGAPTPYDSGTYAYKLYPDGRVRLFGSSNSSYYDFVVLNYELRWTGTAIEGKDRRDDTIVTFTPVP